MPERSRNLIKYVAAAPLDPIRSDWVAPLLELLPAIKTVEFDFWLRTCQTPHVLEPFTSIPTLNASIPAIKSLVTASTQTFRIGTRDIAAYHDIGCRFSRRKRVDLPGLQLALLDLRGLDNVQEKSRMVHKALRFIIEILGQRPPMPRDSIPTGQALVSVGKRLLVHRDFAGFWFSDELTVPSKNQGWRPVDSNGQIVKIGQECKTITWRRSRTDNVRNEVLYGLQHSQADDLL